MRLDLISPNTISKIYIFELHLIYITIYYHILLYFFTMNFKKGFSNIFSSSITNLLIALSLVIIVTLVYIKNKTIDLFDANFDYLQSIVNKYIAKQVQKNEFAIRLATQEQTIQTLQAQANNLFSSF